jgi:hypothetical protein
VGTSPPGSRFPCISTKFRAACVSLFLRRMDVLKKFAIEGVMGVLGHPFLPYIALLGALWNSI